MPDDVKKVYECPCCGVVSFGPFLPEWAVAQGFKEQPRCLNDYCPEKWFNKPLFEQTKDIARSNAAAQGVTLK